MNQQYLLNPAYLLRPDKNRIFILDRRDRKYESIEYSKDLRTFIHPLHAMILTFFTGESPLKETVEDIAYFLSMTNEDVLNFVKPLILNVNSIRYHYENHCYILPTNLLIPKTEGIDAYHYNIKDFCIDFKKMNLTTERPYLPFDIKLMVNAHCSTDCIYCYADRNTKYDAMSFHRIKELINESRYLNVRTFDINGGEILLYKNWVELLIELQKNGYDSLFATKLAIDEKTIHKIKEIGIKRIQFSLDSVIATELATIWNVDKSYGDKILNSIKSADKEGLEIEINCVLSSVNSNVNSIQQLIEFLFQLEHLTRLSFSPAGRSLYKSDIEYQFYNPKESDLVKIEEFLNTFENPKVPLRIGGYVKIEEYLDKNIEAFDKRAGCTGNVDSFYILPDGKVTICEELYWHPDFIIGDLTYQSIEEVWNSPKALALYNLSQELLNDKSACKKCGTFNECRTGKGVCWKIVLEAYGSGNWDFPDPRCPSAPMPYKMCYVAQ